MRLQEQLIIIILAMILNSRNCIIHSIRKHPTLITNRVKTQRHQTTCLPGSNVANRYLTASELVKSDMSLLLFDVAIRLGMKF